jgi:2,3-bisphosphoglycerate-dependent phosphoglycerate mutase
VILLARHGETDDNAPPRRVQGQLDPPLNERGREQARALAREVAAGHEVAALWVSDQRRARETAAIVAEAIGLEPRVDARLAEADWGRWQGELVDDIMRDEPELFRAFVESEPGFRFPDGESLDEHMQRTWAALDDIAAGPLPALAVCHGGTIRCALARSHPDGMAGIGAHRIPNGALIPLP